MQIHDLHRIIYVLGVWTSIWVSGLVFGCLDFYLGVWTCVSNVWTYPPSSSKLERVRISSNPHPFHHRIPSNPHAHHHYNQHPSYQPHQASNQPDPMPSGCHQIIEFWKPPASQDRVIEFWKPLASQDRVKVVRGVRLPCHIPPQDVKPSASQDSKYHQKTMFWTKNVQIIGISSKNDVLDPKCSNHSLQTANIE